MSAFADDLHALCQREIQAALSSGDKSAAMTAELADALANAIAILTCGHSASSRAAARDVVKNLPAMVFDKSALVRREIEAMKAEVSA